MSFAIGVSRRSSARSSLARRAALGAAEQLRDEKAELERGLEFGLHEASVVDVQRLLGQRRAERDAALRVVAREREAAAHRARPR